MATQRQHGTALIAGLVVLGTLGLLGGAAALRIEMTPITRGILWFVAAFIAAHIAKRMLLRLETGTLCAAAVVVIMVAVGIQHRHDGVPIDARILIQLGLTLAGALGGARTARRPTRVTLVFAVLGAGAAGFGASVLGVGIASLIELRHMATGFFIAAPLGALLTTLLVTEVEAIHTAFGESLLFAALLTVVGLGKGVEFDYGLAAFLCVVGAITGWLVGAAGGAIGVHLRGTPKPPDADLPKARQVH